MNIVRYLDQECYKIHFLISQLNQGDGSFEHLKQMIKLMEHKAEQTILKLPDYVFLINDPPLTPPPPHTHKTRGLGYKVHAGVKISIWEYIEFRKWAAFLNVFIISYKTISCGYLKEPSHRDGSFLYPQHIFW